MRCFPTTGSASIEDGTVVLYPMQAETRRRERRREVVDAVVERAGFQGVARAGSHASRSRRAVSGRHGQPDSGSCRACRVREHFAADASCGRRGVGARDGLRACVFSAFDRDGVPLYHTNVLMCVGARVAVIGTEAVAPADRGRVIERLRASGREVIEIGHDEIERFAGNMLELATWDEALGDCRVLVMSEAARLGLSPAILHVCPPVPILCWPFRCRPSRGSAAVVFAACWPKSFAGRSSWRSG